MPAQAKAAEVVDSIAAEVNGEIILYSEARERLFQMKSFSKGISGKTPTVRDALERLVEQKLIIQVGREKEIKVEDKEIYGRRHAMMAQEGLSEEDFLAMIKREGMSLERYNEVMEEQIVAQKLFDMEVRSRVQLSEKAIKKYYENNKGLFTTPKKLRVRHILLTVPPEEPDDALNGALSKISAIRRKITEEGLDFAEAARKYSEGPSGPDGGNLGEIGRGQMVESFDAAAFSLDTGEISEPVRTKFGFHIIKVDSVIGGKQRPLVEVRKEIENKMYMEILEEVRSDWISDIKKDAFIDIKIKLD